MNATALDVYLKPGELYFGTGPGRVRTLLGSCVAFTLWHPRKRLGGMCHFVLPARRDRGEALDARYGEDAIAILVERIRSSGTRPGDYVAGIFGGGNMFPDFNSGMRAVGEQNVATAWRLATAYGLSVEREDVGMYSYRHVTLSLDDGTVELRTTEVRRS